MWILYHYLPKTQPLFSQNRKRKITHVLIAICNAHLVAKYSTMIKQKSVPKARIHQADNLAKLRQKFLSLLELIAQILCA